MFTKPMPESSPEGDKDYDRSATRRFCQLLQVTGSDFWVAIHPMYKSLERGFAFLSIILHLFSLSLYHFSS